MTDLGLIMFLGSLNFKHAGESVVHAAEAHEGHGEEAGGDEGDGHALHAFGYVGQCQLFAETGEDYQGQTEADGGAQGKPNAGEQIGIHAGTVVGAFGHENGYTQDAAVGGDQGEEYSQGLIQGGADFLQDDFHQLHQGCNDEDKGNGLQILQAEGIQHVRLQQIGHQGGQCQHEGHGCTHAHSGVHFFADKEEGADAEELAQDDVIDKDGGDEDQYVCRHGLFL